MLLRDHCHPSFNRVEIYMITGDVQSPVIPPRLLIPENIMDRTQDELRMGDVYIEGWYL
jgi:hypothetical protein